jgi:hypothetical protein
MKRIYADHGHQYVPNWEKKVNPSLGRNWVRRFLRAY